MEKQLPLPQDLVRLKDFLTEQLEKFDVTDTSPENFRKAVNIASGKLLTYNRRRSGELQAVK